MCGIAGFGTSTDVTRAMTPYLLYEIDARGRDSWGATDGRVDDPNHLVKVLGPVLDTYIYYDDVIAAWPRAILHTRGASTGDVTIPNQHPFTFSKYDDDVWVRTVTGIHNGIVSNHDDLDKKYDRKYDVDSMHIFAALAFGTPTREIDGWGNLAWYESTPARPEGVLNLLRFNHEALHACLLETGEVVFASVEEYIRRAARMVGTKVKTHFKLDNEIIYRVEPEHTADGVWVRDHIVDTKVKLPFGFRWSQHSTSDYDQTCENWPQYPTGFGSRSHSYGHGGRGAGYDPGSNAYVMAGAGGGRRTVNLQTVQSDARVAGECAVSGCSTHVKHSRRNNLICEKCYEKAFLVTAHRLETVTM